MELPPIKPEWAAVIVSLVALFSTTIAWWLIWQIERRREKERQEDRVRAQLTTSMEYEQVPAAPQVGGFGGFHGYREKFLVIRNIADGTARDVKMRIDDVPAEKLDYLTQTNELISVLGGHTHIRYHLTLKSGQEAPRRVHLSWNDGTGEHTYESDIGS